MAKGNRGGRRAPGLPSSGGSPFSDGINDYAIPNNLADALGEKGREMSMASAFFDANPYYNKNYAEFSQNCQRCVFAYEMRRRGYNVEALPTYEGDQMPRGRTWTSAMSGMKSVNVGKTTERATIKAIERQMADWGEGSRGIVRVKWAGGSSGHVFNVEQKNGKLYVYDVQNNKRKSNSAYLKETMQYTTLSHTTLFRTDDATPTDAMRFMVRPSTKK